MNTQAISSLPIVQRVLASGPTDVNGKGKPESPFENILKRTAVKRADQEKQADQAAAGLVSQALILPILQQVRRSTLKTKSPFSPGNGEKSFGPEFDIQLSDRIARSPNLGIRKALAQRLLRRTPPAVVEVKKELNLHG